MRTVGVDVGGTSVRAGVVDSTGQIIDTARGQTPPGERALEDVICTVVGTLVERHDVSAVGLAVAGFVGADRATVLFAPHLPWRAAPVADRVAARLGLPVVLEHDANAAAVGEHRYGALRGARVGLLVALGTGIGGALLLDGAVFRGAHGVAPELGHLRLVPDGRACGCGKSGCWERYCSGTALAATALDLLAADPSAAPLLAREVAADPGALTGRKVAAAAREGDPVAQRAVADLAHWLGEGLALAADVYDPEVIVIGGGVSESAELFLDDARAHYTRALTGAGHRPLARIRPAQLGDDAGLVGAAALATESHRSA
ncbi:ROK family protein [Actinokineospora fastidiosa]|uniref:Glucokinase n=1 Tax=Actinokineospora fastidiosa TaxID=1816 RepID=A0A918GIQ5_9PSEU|nr:ROK family protein [Actinokineospora fastidiosa]GGS40449.1 glucokinase [Actinokineospora fastidiosa]